MVVCDNPYIQAVTIRKQGCQIDCLIQTKMNSLVICEFKLSRRELNSSILSELKEKAGALSVPRGFGKAIALFHISGVPAKVAESSELYRIVDLRDWLEV
jgi:hypothetical protein